MNKKRIEEIKARCEAATKGPWRTVTNWGRVIQIMATDPDGTEWELAGIPASYHQDDKDERSSSAEFMAHSRQDIPDLLAAIEERDARIEKMCEAIGASMDILDELPETWSLENLERVHEMCKKALSDGEVGK